MPSVVTLIAGSGARAALPALAGAIGRALRVDGGPVWLAAGEACDLVCASDPQPAAAAARTIIAGAMIDVVAQPLAGRRKRLLVADLESTIIENEMLDELAGLRGIGPSVAAITRRAMNGEIDFVDAVDTRVALLAGIEERVLEQVAARIRPTPGARALVATMRRAGAVAVLVSGGFTVFAERIGAALGFDHVIANRLDIVDGRVAGTVQRPVVTGETKREALLSIAAKHGLRAEHSIAVGDGANDLPMLATAGIGIAFHAKPSVAAAARWRLDHADLTGVLYAQGYRQPEIVD